MSYLANRIKKCTMDPIWVPRDYNTIGSKLFIDTKQSTLANFVRLGLFLAYYDQTKLNIAFSIFFYIFISDMYNVNIF